MSKIAIRLYQYALLASAKAWWVILAAYFIMLFITKLIPVIIVPDLLYWAFTVFAVIVMLLKGFSKFMSVQ